MTRVLRKTGIRVHSQNAGEVVVPERRRPVKAAAGRGAKALTPPRPSRVRAASE